MLCRLDTALLPMGCFAGCFAGSILLGLPHMSTGVRTRGLKASRHTSYNTAACTTSRITSQPIIQGSTLMGLFVEIRCFGN